LEDFDLFKNWFWINVCMQIYFYHSRWSLIRSKRVVVVNLFFTHPLILKKEQ
jgi:hypothetical protein